MARYGPYELLERVGCGGMGEIYLAVLKRGDFFEKSVAIKRILPALSNDPSFVRMFDREARIAALLNHQNIVQIFDYGREGDEYFIAMEYVEGADLRTLLSRQGSPPLEASLAIMLGIARALDYAHRRCDRANRPLDIVHRDVSPGNVLLSREGEVKLTDFGLVTGAIDDASSVAGEMKGKYAYMSPEQTYADPVDCRSDLFSWAVVGYELLSGQRPFTGNIIETVEAIRSGRYAPLDTDTPQDLRELLQACLRVHREERPDSAGVLVRTLERVLVESARADANRCLAEWVTKGCPPTTDQPSPRERTEVGDMPIRASISAALADTYALTSESGGADVSTRTPTRRRRVAALTGLAILAAIATLLAVLLSKGVEPPPPGPRPDSTAAVEPSEPSDRVESIAPVPPVATPKPQPAVLRLDSVPQGAAVVVDDEDRGRTPIELSWHEPGTHAVRLDLEGYRSSTFAVSASLDSEQDRVEELVPLYRVRIDGEPEAAEATLLLTDDTELRCVTPCELAHETAPARLLVEREDFLSFETELASTQFVAGSVRSFSYRLQPREQAVRLEWRSDDVTIVGQRSISLGREPEQLQFDFRDATGDFQGTVLANLRLDQGRVRVSLFARTFPWSVMELAGHSIDTPDSITAAGLREGSHEVSFRPEGTGEPVSIELVIRE